jgi:hypothetical protein
MWTALWVLMRSRPSVLRCSAVFVVGVVVLTGCARSDAPFRPEKSLRELLRFSRVDGRRYVLEVEKRMRSCMKRRGMAYESEANGFSIGGEVPYSLEYRRKHGYGIADALDDARKAAGKAERSRSSERLSPEKGAASQSASEACRTAAQAPVLRMSEIGSHLNEAFSADLEQMRSEGQYGELTRSWQRCMKAAGFNIDADYRNAYVLVMGRAMPSFGLDGPWPTAKEMEELRSKEIGQAVTDYQCFHPWPNGLPRWRRRCSLRLRRITWPTWTSFERCRILKAGQRLSLFRRADRSTDFNFWGGVLRVVWQ